MSGELKPCPFCGGEVETDRYGPDEATPEMAINCRGECQGIFVFPDVAANDYAGLRHAWNTRVTPSQGLDAATVSDAGYQQAFYEIAEMLGIEGPQPLSPKQVFETQMKPRLTALTAADAATVERCAQAIDQAYNERIAQKKAASSRSDSAAKREARDFESMALQASMDAARVRALATDPHQHGGKGA